MAPSSHPAPRVKATDEPEGPATLGKIAYHAYCQARNWKSVRGEALPPFEGQTMDLQDAWEAAGLAVAEQLAVRGYTVTPYTHVGVSKQLRADLDGSLQRLKEAAGFNGKIADANRQRGSRERSIAITKLQEAIMWLGMDLKGLKEAGLSEEPNPYPSSYDPTSGTVEPTAEGLKL